MLLLFMLLDWINIQYSSSIAILNSDMKMYKNDKLRIESNLRMNTKLQIMLPLNQFLLTRMNISNMTNQIVSSPIDSLFQNNIQNKTRGAHVCNC